MQTTPNELALVRAMAPRFDAIVAGVFVRASSGSGRLDLAAPVVGLLQDLARGSARRSQPFVAAFFGNPYVPMSVPELPAMLLTYDFSDDAEESAVRALAGEIPISGKPADRAAGPVPDRPRARPAGGTQQAARCDAARCPRSDVSSAESRCARIGVSGLRRSAAAVTPSRALSSVG